MIKRTYIIRKMIGNKMKFSLSNREFVLDNNNKQEVLTEQEYIEFADKYKQSFVKKYIVCETIEEKVKSKKVKEETENIEVEEIEDGKEVNE